MDRDAFARTRYGRKAIERLRERFPFDESDAWRTVILEWNAIAACERAQGYHPLIDWNDSQRRAYLQGRRSREDVKAAIWTVLDSLDAYGNEVNTALHKTADRELLGDYPDSALNDGLFALLDSLDQSAPEDFTPDETPHHYRLGPLQFPKPITSIDRKPDPQWTGLAWGLETLFRLAATGNATRLQAGDAMPEGPYCFELTAAFLQASIDPKATADSTRDRLNKITKAHPGITWADWPMPWRFMRPCTTSVIRTRRKARRD